MKNIIALVVIAFLFFSVSSCKKKEKEIEPAAPSIGNVAPDFALKDVDGRSIRLSAYKGKVVLVEFWATWCPPCRELTPVLNRLYEKYKDKGFVILALTPEDTDTVKDYIKDHQVKYTVVIATQKTINQYGVIGIPMSFLIDKEGKIVNKHMYTPDFFNELSSEIEKLL